MYGTQQGYKLLYLHRDAMWKGYTLGPRQLTLMLEVGLCQAAHQVFSTTSSSGSEAEQTTGRDKWMRTDLELPTRHTASKVQAGMSVANDAGLSSAVQSDCNTERLTSENGACA